MSKRHFILVLAVALFSIVFALSAYGEEKQKEQKQDCVGSFMQLDADKNGVVDSAEVEKTAKGDFKKLDKNNDGVINGKDGKIFLRKADIAIIDRDKDGNITVDEYVIYFTDNFKKVDLNKDGKVTKDEMEKYCKERASKRK